MGWKKSKFNLKKKLFCRIVNDSKKNWKKETETQRLILVTQWSNIYSLGLPGSKSKLIWGGHANPKV